MKTVRLDKVQVLYLIFSLYRVEVIPMEYGANFERGTSTRWFETSGSLLTCKLKFSEATMEDFRGRLLLPTE